MVFSSIFGCIPSNNKQANEAAAVSNGNCSNSKHKTAVLSEVKDKIQNVSDEVPFVLSTTSDVETCSEVSDSIPYEQTSPAKDTMQSDTKSYNGSEVEVADDEEVISKMLKHSSSKMSVPLFERYNHQKLTPTESQVCVRTQQRQKTQQNYNSDSSDLKEITRESESATPRSQKLAYDKETITLASNSSKVAIILKPTTSNINVPLTQRFKNNHIELAISAKENQVCVRTQKLQNKQEIAKLQHQRSPRGTTTNSNDGVSVCDQSSVGGTSRNGVSERASVSGKSLSGRSVSGKGEKSLATGNMSIPLTQRFAASSRDHSPRFTQQAADTLSSARMSSKDSRKY